MNQKQPLEVEAMPSMDSHDATLSTMRATNSKDGANSKTSFAGNMTSQSASVLSGPKNAYPPQRQVVSNRYDSFADEASQLTDKESM